MTVATDAGVWAAGELHVLADELGAMPAADLPMDLLDQLDALERIKSAAAAAQVTLSARLIDIAEAAEDSPADGRRRPARAISIGAEVALAVRTSPSRGEHRVMLSRRLRDDLPGVHAALATGEVNEQQAFAVAREVAHLEPAQRTAVDADLVGRAGGLAGLGDGKLRKAVRRSCLTIAADAETRRHHKARADRHITTRQLDDGTGRLTAVMPIEHLAATRAALDASVAQARADGDERTAGQVRVDTVVQRLTGHDPAAPLPVRVNLTIGVEALLGDSAEPGLVDGIGWLPAALCTDLVRRASAAAKTALRRLFTGPFDGPDGTSDRALVAMESRSRAFPTALGELIAIRDGGTCRTPGCDAAIRHLDHVERVADGGPTSYDNGQGLCERCNYVKETPGWATWVAPPSGAGPDPGPHEVHGATEHLRLYRSTPPPPPGGPNPTAPACSPGELHVRRALALVA